MTYGAINTIGVLVGTGLELVRLAEGTQETLTITFENTHSAAVTIEVWGYSSDQASCRRLHTIELSATKWSASWEGVRLAAGMAIWAKATVANVITVGVEEDIYS